MNLTKGQEKALKAIHGWLKTRTGHWMFSLAGFAGTGKTTLLQHLIGELKVPFFCCAPTGKAASVLRAKLPGVPVKTVHQLLYNPQNPSMTELQELEEELMRLKEAEHSTAGVRIRIAEARAKLAKNDVSFKLKEAPAVSPSCLVICDEASMVSERMLKDMEGLGCRVLFVGDAGQLPPVKEAAWFIDYEHDVRLEEIVRQALDSPIIRLSMEVRAGTVDLSQYRDGNCVITTKDKVDYETWLSADQVLTGANAARQRVNRFFRKRLGLKDELPMKGEKLICLKNDHQQNPQWINGIQFSTLGCCIETSEPEVYGLQVLYLGYDLNLEFYGYHCHTHYRQGLTEEPRELRKGLFEADYAYAITVHKSQGSEWPFVIVADDQMQKEQKEFRKKWLYTAITRAKERLLIVQ